MTSSSEARRVTAPTKLGHIVAAALGGAAVLAIGGAVVRQTMVDAWVAAGAPAQIAGSVPASAMRDLRAATARVEAKDWTGAAPYAAEALARSPINVQAVRILGLSAELGKGREAEAGRWLELAGQLGWRDTPTQLWLISKAAAFGDINNLILRADALLRRNEAQETIRPLLRSVAADPQGAQLLAERLAAAPSWRGSFLRTFSDLNAASFAGHEALLAALAKTEAPPSRAEQTAYLRKLIALKEPGRARAVWARLGKRSDDGGLTDGSFSAAGEYPAEEAIPFEWSVRNGAGAGALIESVGGNALLVAQTDGGALTTVASQTLALPQGLHRFSADLVAGEASVDRLGFAWGVRCAPSNHTIYPEQRPAISGSGARRTLSFTFAVPAGCPAQILELRSSRLSPPMSTEARFDNVRITRGG